MTFNDRSSTLSLLTSRRSGKARDMVAPGPSAEDLDAMLAAAMRVPDHGKLAPWRFVMVDTDARAGLETLLVDSYRAEKPEAGRSELEAMRSFAHHAPCLIVLMARLNETSHIPLWEQQLSVGAAAMQLLNAGHALGYVGNWLTGWPAYSAAVGQALGEPGERVAGFFFFGSAAKTLEERPRPERQAVVRHWQAG
jgi:nitroreductase